jgi:hypothetical protein
MYDVNGLRVQWLHDYAILVTTESIITTVLVTTESMILVTTGPIITTVLVTTKPILLL